MLQPANIPPMEPPPPVEFFPVERLQQLYAQLPTLFAKSIAKRQQHAPGLTPIAPNLKRDRSDESAADSMNKRRNTGESKSERTPVLTSQPLPTPASSPNGLMNGSLPQNQENAPQMPSINTRQAQMRAASVGPGQISPPSAGTMSNLPNQGPSQIGPNAPLSLNPPGVGNPSPAAFQNMLNILQTGPSHAFVQYMYAKIPGFGTLTLQQQVQKMLQVQVTHFVTFFTFGMFHLPILTGKSSASTPGANAATDWYGAWWWHGRGHV
jgi:hypothetical protein